MKIEKALVMAVAAVAEELGVEPKRVRVTSFKEVQKSSLEKYIEDHHIDYEKYQMNIISQ